jgi:hypothetical protein
MIYCIIFNVSVGFDEHSNAYGELERIGKEVVVADTVLLRVHV